MHEYHCHKVVKAAQIIAVEGYVSITGDFVVVLDGDGPVYLTPETVARYTPVVGDYLVEYQPDGYRSVSPRQVFEDGYHDPRDTTAARAGKINHLTDLEAYVARVCHEVNRAACAACAAFGDHSQVAWADAPEWQRESAIKGVAFTLAHPDAKPSDNHDSWLAEKIDAGWVYGPVKDLEAKTHPCCVPYDELPPEQKLKDYLFQAVVRALA